MRNRLTRFSILAAFLVVFSILLPGAALAQNLISGEITGTVTDPSGAVVPNATVTLTQVDLGIKTVTTTSTAGTYRFPLLRPATYRVSVTASGFGMAARNIVVDLGQVTQGNIQLNVSGKTEIVEVTADAELLHAESANMSATLDEKQVELLPNSGGDLTNFALTTPGVALSTGGGYGNFTSNGIGGMSNLYTINGNDYNDAYLNLNNSGSSNMLLGSNEVQEATVVTNGYTAQYGRMAGTNLTITTKSGSNTFHGTADWLWNGTKLNANDWFAKPNAFNGYTATARPHAVSNQWAGDAEGPIFKNKLFFFYDNEGIRYVLPAGGVPVYIPTTAFETAVINNLKNVSPASVPFYQQAFTVYNGASGYSRAVPVTTDNDPALGCGDIYSTDPKTNATSSSLAGLTPYSTPCALTFQTTANSLNTERLQTIRVDWNLSDKDKFNFRYKGDRGLQATSTDPINNNFSANSLQPQDEGQFNWTRTLNNTMVNQFIASDLHYVAKFGPPNFSAATKTFPTTLVFSDGLYTTLGNFFGYPSGRVVEQYQFVDDFTWTKGSHGIKAGVNYRRNDISDFSGSSQITGEITSQSMTSFANGIVDGGGNLTQSFSKAPEVPVAFYSLGMYVQDEWRLNPKLKLTYGLRVDSNSNEVCQKNCFSRPVSSFSTMDHSAGTPYNTSIKAVTQAFPGLEPAAWGPRGGFDWTPLGDKTVIRGGLGIFSTLYPGLLGSRAITNMPNYATFTITSGPVSPAAANSTWTQAAANNTALQNAYSSGGTYTSIKAALPSFTAPALTTFATHVVNPKYLKWNLEVEHSFGDKTAISVNYVGNHGYDLFITNRSLNTYCSVTNCPNGFEGLPSTAPDTRFANIREYDNGGVANYAGLTVSATQRVTKGFTGTFNYTWSHALDELYEGGIEPLFGTATDNPSFMVAIDPANIHKYNYASADQDIRHLATANFYWDLPTKIGTGDLAALTGGWIWSATFQATSGTPFSVYYSSVYSSMLTNDTSGKALAIMNTKGTGSCGKPNPNSPCFTSSQFLKTITPGSAQTTWGGGYNTRRNNFRGPGYFDSDMEITKRFQLTEKGMTLSFSAEAYNFFNHPNFDRPVGSLTSGSFGKILATVGQPNSPYGNFEGGAVNGRIIQSSIKLKF